MTYKGTQVTQRYFRSTTSNLLGCNPCRNILGKPGNLCHEYRKKSLHVVTGTSYIQSRPGAAYFYLTNCLFLSFGRNHFCNSVISFL